MISADGAPSSDAHTTAATAVLRTEESGRRQSETIKSVGPNLYVALAAVHFKNHTGAAAAATNKSGPRQVKSTVYAPYNAENIATDVH